MKLKHDLIAVVAKAQGDAKNVISIYAGRHDYYDHRRFCEAPGTLLPPEEMPADLPGVAKIVFGK